MSGVSPAERFAAASEARRHPLTKEFAEQQRFTLDPFQIAGCQALEDGRSVLVAAPTGAGKTIVGEFAVHLAMREPGDKAFYTTPMKALSNQKFRELQEVYGEDEVGLLTGDTNINGNARVVVMTTEVLRNMLYADSPALRGLRFVVMDEVHYLADRFRGAVWEEVIIHLPPSVRLVSLSATVSNAEEFGDWLDTVRGDTEVIVSETRPVPLEQHVLVRGDLLPLFDDRAGIATAQVNQELMRIRSVKGRTFEENRRAQGHNSARDAGYEPTHRRPQRGGRRPVRPGNVQRVERLDRPGVVQLLQRANLLPAIFFIFSRAGCDGAVQQVRRSGLRLTDGEERAEIRRLVDERTATLNEEDLDALGYWEWRDNLERGIAAHHAGLLPAFKEVVEELFRRKLVKVVFATETLALGINMPARTVVLEKLEKFNGEARVAITSGEYTQITGRAGRRGIDVEGHAVIQWTESLDPQAVAALASRRTYPLNSSFRPTYNMAVNLIDRFGRPEAREILESSFAQFQADRSVVGLARQVREAEESLAGYQAAMTCDRGDFAEYSAIRRELSDLEKLNRADRTAPARIRKQRQQEMESLRRRILRHPCHDCPDREHHARWAERYWKLKRRADKLRNQIQTRTGTVARVFDRVVDVLSALDYVAVDEEGRTTLTAAGRTMRRIYGERDLLVAEALRRGIWENLDAPSLAALACSLVYEPRRDSEGPGEYGLPRGPFRTALTETQLLWSRLDDLEREHHLPGTEPVATGLAQAMYTWARGGMLDRVLTEADLAAGDFVRWAKQTIDLLDQLSLVADAPVASTARKALDAVRRGIVAYSGA
ncbi:DEAD/DEAH box helicase [Microbacterium sp. zg.Y1090]|uniref:DEAD/DEAH box helicase n=1 Tax=Microbacterium TaxID=33882 RepID=UPI00214AC2BF|nr:MULTISPECIES: DEAD/DEAH box helicase [unclassified Microbacterium]MCR2811957.1 DEAD/DEAH box helicase [Microbacterium sp. zg.Y1084]MCR2818604.1 DEAD/DEAH box helicase [Microbacterium sp. zg.Y1090]MDL5486418.1 DEAD/DEAH box helicase [Microbacterium sp. zg-Y1211]WIM29605.1 DEAD/DEAH box helicase [Microbacterium sp. zg-Y1090]